MRTRTKLLILLVGLLTACQRQPTPLAPVATRPARSGTLNEIVNIVEGRAAEAQAYAPVALGYVVEAGGALRTGADSRARLDLNDGTIMRLASLTEFSISDLPAADESQPLARLQLEFGKIWASLTGGGVEVTTPVGVATVRGSFAVFEYLPGDRSKTDDDILIVSCLEGACRATNASVDERLGALEQVILTNGGTTVTRFALTDADVQDFVKNNPEALRMVATLTAIVPTATATATPSATPAQTSTPAPTATATATPTPTHTATPAFAIVGEHTVKAGETLFCIGRGYGILPQAIAEANALTIQSTLSVGQVLRMPDAQWTGISVGPVCAPQFNSPYPGLPTSTPGAPPTATATATARVTTTAGPTATQTSLAPSPTPTASATATFAAIDTTPPTISGFSASPTTADARASTCTVTFSVVIADAGGINTASVEWTTYNGQGLPVASGSVPMRFLSGSSTNAVWEVAHTITQLPATGLLQWGVKAWDVAKNNILLASDLPILTGSAGCP